MYIYFNDSHLYLRGYIKFRKINILLSKINIYLF